MKYRKKPVEVEAMQLFQTDLDFAYKKEVEKDRHLMGFYHNVMGAKIWLETNRQNIVVAQIETLEGNHRFTDGDWLIKGVAGEYYFCKPDIFEATYEPVPMREFLTP